MSGRTMIAPPRPMAVMRAKTTRRCIRTPDHHMPPRTLLFWITVFLYHFFRHWWDDLCTATGDIYFCCFVICWLATGGSGEGSCNT